MIWIDVAPAARAGLFTASLSGRHLVTSREPLLAAARALLSEGCDPADVLIMRWATTGTSSLTASIAVAAGLTVREDTRDGVPRYVPYREYRSPVASPVRSLDQGATWVTGLSSYAPA